MENPKQNTRQISPLPWEIVRFPDEYETGEPVFFIRSVESRLSNGMPRPEILAEDAHEGNGYPYKQKLADAEFILKACNNFDKIIEVLNKVSKDFEQFPCRPSTARDVDELLTQLEKK